MCVCVCINMCVYICTYVIYVLLYVMCVCSIYLLLPQDKAFHYVWPVYATIQVSNKVLAHRECD